MKQIRKFSNGIRSAESVARYSLPIHALAFRTTSRRNYWEGQALVSAMAGYPGRTARNLRRSGSNHETQDRIMEQALRQGRVRLNILAAHSDFRRQQRANLANKYGEEASELEKKRGLQANPLIV